MVYDLNWNITCSSTVPGFKLLNNGFKLLNYGASRLLLLKVMYENVKACVRINGVMT